MQLTVPGRMTASAQRLAGLLGAQLKARIDAVEQRALACAGLTAQHRHLSLHRGEQCIRHVPFSGDEHRVAALPVILDLRVDR